MNDIDRLEERIATLENFSLKETERLENKIRVLENELDEVYKMIEQTMQVK